jgi:hypothetical protein
MKELNDIYWKILMKINNEITKWLKKKSKFNGSRKEPVGTQTHLFCWL